MDELAPTIDRTARETGFSGVVRVDARGVILCERAYGFAHRAAGVENTPATRFGLASGTKSFTALATVSLIEAGTLRLDTTARSLLGKDLPLIDDGVTVEHLLSHRSGIGDYLDESLDPDLTDYLMSVPVHTFATTEGYLDALEGRAPKFPPGEQFSYCNSGYVVLALLAERATGTDFTELVQRLVCEPAGLLDTAFHRSDALPSGAAMGYLHVTGDRSNVLHLPVRGCGDGGIASTVADIRTLWGALVSGRVVPEPWITEMTRTRGTTSSGNNYGMGFWLPADGRIEMEGCDAGVSFRSVHDPARDLTWTVVSNTTLGAWPLCRALERWASGTSPTAVS